MTTTDSTRGRLVEIGEPECWDLLSTRPVGRIAWRGSEGVSVFPVNFAVEGHAVVLRTSPYSLIARDCVDREVAFQVDQIDEDDHTGWTVLLRGRCVREPRPADAATPWVTGPRLLGLKVDARSISGRRVAPH
ncbi:MAG TPA: pyridoxamine 5'-phosphate oxidase family protein [Nocardioides sp.]|nr:pyridoxamine 5'-phosphate oxidase family protein [Nocardioides sp.]